jgi:hypothetical protein
MEIRMVVADFVELLLVGSSLLALAFLVSARMCS